MERISVAGGSIAGRLDGQNDAPVIILSNSLGTDMRLWEPQMGLLLRRYRVLRYDTRGHGQSDPIQAPYSFRVLMDDVLALLDHYGVDRATYMGLSLGGMTGLGLALQHSDRITRLVCCDARAYSPPEFRAAWQERTTAAAAGGMAAIVDAAIDRWLSPRTQKDRPELVQEVRSMILTTSVPGYLGSAAAIQELDFLNSLSSIEIPVLYLTGANDGGAPPEVVGEMARRTPASEYLVLPDAAHISNLDNTPAFNRAIERFLDSGTV